MNTKDTRLLSSPRGEEQGVSPAESTSGGLTDPWLYASGKAARIAAKDSAENEFARWIMGFGPYEWFVTRTLDRERVQSGFTQPGLGTARTCLRQLLVYTQAKRVACVFELHDDGVPHLHAVIGGCRGINGAVAKRDDEQLWGWSKWLPFKATGGAPRYLGKYLGKDFTELYVGRDGPWSIVQLSGSTLGGLRV